jgi:hypothetical protein
MTQKNTFQSWQQQQSSKVSLISPPLGYIFETSYLKVHVSFLCLFSYNIIYFLKLLGTTICFPMEAIVVYLSVCYLSPYSRMGALSVENTLYG